jgi:hypothetical protein
MEMLLVVLAALSVGGVTLWVISLLARASTKQKQISGVVIDPTITILFGQWMTEQVSIGQAARIQSVTKTELEKVFGRPVVVRTSSSPVSVRVKGDMNPHATSVAIDIAMKIAMSVK